jgi:hypothetical protein
VSIGFKIEMTLMSVRERYKASPMANHCDAKGHIDWALANQCDAKGHMDWAFQRSGASSATSAGTYNDKVIRLGASVSGVMSCPL